MNPDLKSQLKSQVRSRLVVLAAVVAAGTALTFTGVRFVIVPGSPPPAHASLPPSPSSYLGVYEAGAPPSYSPIAAFARVTGTQPNLAGYYSGWTESFAASFARKVRAHGVIPYVQIDPTYASVSAIARGTYDGYLRSYADSVRDFGHAVVIGFGHEMNAPWYSWGYGHVPPSTFIAAWRHVVSVFRGQGAENVTWLWTVNQDRPDTGPVASWWPGPKYVTWVGIDGYYFQPSDTFARAFGSTIDQVRAFTDKPVLLSETAVAPDIGQFAKIGNLFDGIRRAGVLGLVWFDVAQHGGLYHQDWRIEDSPVAEVAFRFGASALTLTRP
jgi:Glycosyl hydrolase family 26